MNEMDKWIQELLPRPKIDTFGIHHHPYYIFTFSFRQESAGFRVLYYLCHVLNECGYEAYVLDEKPVSGLRTPILTYEIIRRHKEEERHPIAVYNEAIVGNPLCGDIVVRWIMNKRGDAYDKEIGFSHDDLIYYWAAFYAKSKENITLLNLPTVDRSIFNTDGVNDEERSGFCYYAHKYLKFRNGQAQLPREMTINGTSLCQDIKRTPIEIAEILKHSKVLYCYEPSAIIIEAALCGCLTVIVKTDYLNGFNMKEITDITQIAEDCIDYNFIPSADIILSTSVDMEKAMWESVGLFISQTQNAAQDYKPVQSEENSFTSFCKKHNDNLYVYGTGDVSWNCHLLMNLWNLHIKGFIVSDNYTKSDTPKKTHFGLPVFSLSEIEDQKDACGLILAMIVPNQNEVIKMLDRCGFKNYMRY